jgi:hypothetical protein
MEATNVRYGVDEGRETSTSGLQPQPIAPVNTSPPQETSHMSPELYQMADVQAGQQVDGLTLR